MKAIVLSCDRYHPMANHMVLSYQSLWPSNKFKFLIPWNDKFPNSMKTDFNEKVDLIKTPVEFKKTISGLLDGIPDHEWIFWCTDDTYLAKINEEEANKTHEFVESIDDSDIIGVTFGYIRQVPQNVDMSNSITYENLKYVKRTYLTNQWAHQYWRVKVLRYMFECLDEAPKHNAKQMDYMLKPQNAFWKIIQQGKMYSLDHNVATWGESTHRNKMTKNCVESFKTYGLSVPDTFEKVGKEIYFK